MSLSAVPVETAGPARTTSPPFTPHEGLDIADTWQAIERLLPELRDLYRHSTAACQFSSPDVLLTWARVLLGRAPTVVVVRSARGLEAAAVFAVRWVGGARVLQLLGIEPDARLVELPEIVTRADGSAAKPVRRILEWAAAPERGVDWAVVSVADHQGWPEGSWAQPACSLLGTTRASVVLPICPQDWQAELPKVKRNLRESLRRARNRLNRTGRPWRVDVTDDFSLGWPGALADLRELHGQRSQLSGPQHPDYLRSPRIRALLVKAAGVSPATRLEIRRLMLDDRPIAALLTLRDSTGLWISVSGVSAEGWEFSAVTLLMAHAVRAAAHDGVPQATFSVGVDDSKLRWSEQVRRHHEFVLVRPGWRSRLLFTVHTQVRAFSRVQRAFLR